MWWVLSWDRFLGALLGFMLAWILYSVLNQVLWLPQEREKGRQEIRMETLAKAIDLYQERSRTNEDVKRLSDSAICIELGGVWNDGVCG